MGWWVGGGLGRPPTQALGDHLEPALNSWAGDEGQILDDARKEGPGVLRVEVPEPCAAHVGDLERSPLGLIPLVRILAFGLVLGMLEGSMHFVLGVPDGGLEMAVSMRSGRLGAPAWSTG